MVMEYRDIYTVCNMGILGQYRYVMVTWSLCFLELKMLLGL